MMAECSGMPKVYIIKSRDSSINVVSCRLSSKEEIPDRWMIAVPRTIPKHCRCSDERPDFPKIQHSQQYYPVLELPVIHPEILFRYDRLALNPTHTYTEVSG
ncbi:hypothetical protein NPIL_20811 [Nephila pilipes]|uniref:Uncharacterized protein n=1 Tax=Nephila pilipes TaxID=299642 RepID=A0A8X6PA87_NEPPI|nr:hypothetical protein NPIL_20811 [Nephila pilipes]